MEYAFIGISHKSNVQIRHNTFKLYGRIRFLHLEYFCRFFRRKCKNEGELEKAHKYAIIPLTELPGANNT